MNENAVIHVEGLEKSYGPLKAVDRVSFQVYQGEIFGMVGPNGSGKTTTIECVEGLRRPDRIVIQVLGLDPQRDNCLLQGQPDTCSRTARGRICTVPSS